MKTIEISDTAYARLLELGAGLFSPSEVIDRLLTRNGAANPPHRSRSAATARRDRDCRDQGVRADGREGLQRDPAGCRA